MTEASEVGLLACPFCGEHGAHAEVVRPGIWGVHCPNGLCPTSGNFVVTDFSEDEAIAAWNTRTPPPPVSEDYLRDIARKAYENGPPEGLTTGPDWEYLTDEMRESCIAFTRNVLAALANPTEKV